MLRFQDCQPLHSSVLSTRGTYPNTNNSTNYPSTSTCADALGSSYDLSAIVTSSILSLVWLRLLPFF